MPPQANVQSTGATDGRASRLALRLALLPTALMLCLIVGATAALAAGPPITEGSPGVLNVTATSAHLYESFRPNSAETEYRLEYATGEGGPWVGVPGGGGTVPAPEGTEKYRRCSANLTGLSPDTTYYVRLFAKNSYGEATSSLGGFRTSGPPEATTLAVHALHGEDIRALASVSVNGADTNEEQTLTVGGGATGGTFTITFEGDTTAPIPFIPHETEPGQSSENSKIEEALQALPNIGAGNVSVHENFLTQVYTVEFTGALAGKDLLQMTVDASGLTPSGIVTVATNLNGAPFDAAYHFQYVSREKFGASGWTEAASSPQVDLGGGSQTEYGGDGHSFTAFDTTIVAQDLPGLQPGTAYLYRIVATNTSAGDPVVQGNEQTLAVATPGPFEEPSCPNGQFRTGLSAGLPDCRAYEQITPAAKGGAEDIYNYGSAHSHLTVGEDGAHVAVHTFAKWGPSPGSYVSEYFFTRLPGGWQITSATPQPEAGEATYEPELYSPDLTQLGLATYTQTKLGSHSAQQEFIVGPPGGLYTAVVSSPFSHRENVGGGVAIYDTWVAASADFHKLVLRTTDHALLGPSTGTTEGYDLYEWSNGQLRQLNVLTNGSPLGACGASIVRGDEGYEGGEQAAVLSSPNAVSADGSRIFFEAVPGNNCSEPSHLYMRAGGTETVDIGAYKFRGANAAGSELLLEQDNSGTLDFVLYDTATASTKHLFSAGLQWLIVSKEFNAVYFESSRLTPEAPSLASGEEDLYRYDIRTKTLHFIVSAKGEGATGGGFSVSPDGRYFYFASHGVNGVPGGSGNVTEVYRYDNAESVVQCMSCASSFDPEPKVSATFLPEGANVGLDNGLVNGTPEPMVASANGDYVFFDTASQLVPQDINGEIVPVVGEGHSLSTANFFYSESSDVYEWRKNGVHGCTHVQGCLALITDGKDGFKNMLLGTTPSGDDVFFATHSQLVPQDQDTGGDVYDARIGGGFPPPASPPVECEGDACQSPLAAPIDTTPASLTFSGSGNPTSALATPKPKAKPTVKSCGQGMVRKKGKCVKKPRAKTKKGRAKKAVRRAVKRNRWGSR